MVEYAETGAGWELRVMLVAVQREIRVHKGVVQHEVVPPVAAAVPNRNVQLAPPTAARPASGHAGTVTPMARLLPVPVIWPPPDLRSLRGSVAYFPRS
jgi:hypothetical protein